VKILDDLISGLATDAPTRELRVGRFWTAVWSRQCGLSSTTGPGQHEHGASFVQGAGSLAERSALELARLAYSDSTLEVGIGLAAINSLVEVDEARCLERNAGDLLVERGRDKRVALIGHFPFVPVLREAAAHLSVLERRPQPGDAPAGESEVALPRADAVAITGSAFINHTLEHLLALRRADSFAVVLGPTAPLSPVLFDHGVDVISGTRVVDPDLALRCLSQGATFRHIRGKRLLTMARQSTARAP
jgi:uncharacterized protein (DUF4213/DUF364 family)